MTSENTEFNQPEQPEQPAQEPQAPQQPEQPAQAPQGYGQPGVPPQGYGQPGVPPQGYGQPYGQAYGQQAQVPFKVNTNFSDVSVWSSIVAIVGGFLTMIGAFGSWASVDTGFMGSISASGVSGGGGWLTLLLGITGGVFAFFGMTTLRAKMPWSPIVVVSAGGLALLIEIFNIVDVVSVGSDYGVSASVGWGLILALLGTIAMIAGGVIALLQKNK